MKELLKFITCGSVDDGKSTLIGHMIYESNLIYADQAEALKQVQVNGNIDYSLLLDGLMDERAQGITIDVAYRYFNTDQRSFILADTPGHEQYTRNMAVGAAFADLAIVLVDVTKGILPQTKRHIHITKMMGIKHYVLAINKMDLVDYSQTHFDNIVNELNGLKLLNEANSFCAIPLSATKGDNVVKKSLNMAFYDGPTLMEWLDSLDLLTNSHSLKNQFIMPVQRINRGENGFRTLQGELCSGTIKKGNEIIVYPSKEKSTIKTIYSGFDEVEQARLFDPVSVRLSKEVDVSRGDVLSNEVLPVTSSFDATLLWLDSNIFNDKKEYYLRIHTKQTLCKLKSISKVNNITGDVDNNQIEMNHQFVSKVETIDNVTVLPFEENKTLGGFILIDVVTNSTVAVGTIQKVHENNRNLTQFNFTINPKIRANQKNQFPVTIWFTGLSGSGKSYSSNQLEVELVKQGFHTMNLDGDYLRKTINKDLSFTIEDRIKNIHRTAELAKILNDAGIVVLVSLISPLKEEREAAKKIIGSDKYIEVFVDTPLEVCIERDSKGLYKKAINGEIQNFTGISSPYEKPTNPSLIIDENSILDNLFESVVKLISGT
jgi:bifunctional enzyme CysN/CysC